MSLMSFSFSIVPPLCKAKRAQSCAAFFERKPTRGARKLGIVESYCRSDMVCILRANRHRIGITLRLRNRSDIVSNADLFKAKSAISPVFGQFRFRFQPPQAINP